MYCVLKRYWHSLFLVCAVMAKYEFVLLPRGNFACAMQDGARIDGPRKDEEYSPALDLPLPRQLRECMAYARWRP